jgi:acyl carrier protein
MANVFSRASVRERLFDMFGRFAAHKVPVSEASTVAGDLGLDSINIMELVTELEETFGLAIPDEEIAAIGTVGDAINAVTDRLAADGRLT